MTPRITEMFRRFPTGPVPPSDGTHYSFKPNLVGDARTFELTASGLKWKTAAKSGEWPFDKIAAIRLSYRPTSMQSRRYRADIEDSRGDRITLYSTNWQTVALLSPQDDSYRAFIVELHRRLAAIKSSAYLVVGINPVIYYVGLLLMALVAVAMTVLLIRALWIGEFAGALFLIGFAALFAWQLGGFMKRNRPRSYTLDALPADVLPR